VGELKKGVLGIGSGFSEDDRTGFNVQRIAVFANRLAVAFHVKLLDMRGKPAQRRGIGNDPLGFVS